MGGRARRSVQAVTIIAAAAVAAIAGTAAPATAAPAAGQTIIAHLPGVCWGSNASGEVGDGTTTPRATAVPVIAAQDAAQERHVTLQRVHPGRGRGLTPDDIDQPASADDLAAMQRQRGQYRHPPQTRHWLRPALQHDINWPREAAPA